MRNPLRTILFVADRRHRAFGLTNLVLWLLVLSVQGNLAMRTGDTTNELIMLALVLLFLVSHLRIGALTRAHERGLRATMNLLYSTRYMTEIAGMADTGVLRDDLRRLKATVSGVRTPSVVVSVALVSIEDVRNVLGDRVGSETVKQLARILRRVTRGDDLVAYAGGGRFAILLVDCSVEQSMQFTRRIPATVVAAGGGHVVTLSVEVESYDVTSTELEELVAAIDGALCLPYPVAAAHSGTTALPDAA